MSIRKLAAGAALASLSLISGCGHGPTGGAEAAGLLAADVPRATAGAAPVAGVTDGMLSFAADLYRSAAKAGSNTVVSPLSVALAASMLRAGAGGQTAAEIDRVLHFPTTGRDAAFNRLTQLIVTTDRAPQSPTPGPTPSAGDLPAPVVAIANGLFVRPHLQVGPPFLRTLAADYGAGLRTVDFATPGAAGVLNGWVREHTAGRIERLFDQLDPATQLVLANAIYLKASWATPFEATLTKPAPFHRADGTIAVPTMHSQGELSYASAPGWQAVEIPYAGGTLAMRILLPTGQTPVGALLSATVFQAATKALRPATVELAMPRWDFGTDLDLSTALDQLGMPTAFTGSADFSAIAPGLFVSAAVHRANITVDERGTEAAAVTAFGMVGSAPWPPKQVVIMHVDRPFAFEVVHRSTGTPLFVGSVADPGAKS